MLQRVSAPPLAPSTTRKEQPCKFGTIVRALWPDKPALNLSQRMGCSERHAQFLINGDRGDTLEAWLAVIHYARE